MVNEKELLISIKNKYQRYIEIINSKEYKEFINQFKTTNETFYINGEDEIGKCYIVYDILMEKIKIMSISDLFCSDIITYSYNDCVKILKWLEEKLKK